MIFIGEKMMYKYMAFALLAFACVLSATAAAQSSGDNALSIASLKVTPQPLIAGSNATVVFQLYNSYSSSLNNVNIQVTASTPVINVSPSSSVLVSSIGTGLYGGGIGYSNFYYTFHIPSTLQAGEYSLDVVANYQTPQPTSQGIESLPAQSVMPINLYVYGSPQINLTASTQSQIVPGVQSPISISVLNGGTDRAYNLSVTVLNSDAFKVVGPSTFSIGSLASNAQGLISPSVQPSSSISNGTYYINAIVAYQTAYGEKIKKNVSIPIDVVVNNPNIVVSIESASPQNIYLGSNQTLTFDIENIGLGEAKNVSVDFTNGQGIGIGSASNFFFGSIPAGSSQTETLFIRANQSSALSNYSLPVKISYSDSNYLSNVSKTEHLKINVQSSALFNVTSIEGTLIPGASYVPLTVSVKNIGNEQAGQVTFSVQTIYPLSPVNPNVYINQIAPGETVNAVFYMSVDQNGNSGSYPITVYEQWKQPNAAQSQQFSASQNYFANVTSKGTGSGNAYIIGAVVIIVVAAVAYMRLKKRSAAKASAKKKG